MDPSAKPVLVIAPHPDDEILGVGGTIAKYTNMGWPVTVLTVSGHTPPLYSPGVYEATVEEALKAHALVGVTDSRFLELPCTMLGTVPVHELNGLILEAVRSVEPAIVLCPYPDRHIDHRLVFDATMVATRPVDVGRKIERRPLYANALSSIVLTDDAASKLTSASCCVL